MNKWYWIVLLSLVSCKEQRVATSNIGYKNIRLGETIATVTEKVSGLRRDPENDKKGKRGYLAVEDSVFACGNGTLAGIHFFTFNEGSQLVEYSASYTYDGPKTDSISALKAVLKTLSSKDLPLIDASLMGRSETSDMRIELNFMYGQRNFPTLSIHCTSKYY